MSDVIDDALRTVIEEARAGLQSVADATNDRTESIEPNHVETVARAAGAQQAAQRIADLIAENIKHD